MKKIILLLVFCAALTATASAKAIGEKSFLSELYIGGAVGLEKSGMNMDNKSFAWGHGGLEVGISWLYFLTDNLGLGLDFHYAGFQGSDKESWDRSVTPYRKRSFSLNTETWNIMAAGRVHFNPHGRMRIYMPFGGGLVIGHSRFKYTYNSWSDYTLRASATSANVGAFAGLGLEYDLYDGAVTAGLETRYSLFRYDAQRLATRIQADNHPGKQTYSYISLLAVVSFQ